MAVQVARAGPRSTSSGSRCSQRRLQLAAALAQLRLDVVAGRAARRPPARWRSGASSPVSSSSMPYSLTCSPRLTAYSRSATLCCLEPVRCWSTFPNWSGATTRKSTASPLWVTPRAPASPLRARPRRSPPARRRPARQRRRVVGGRDHVEVLAGVGHAPRAARRSRPGRPPGARAARSTICSPIVSTAGQQQPLARPCPRPCRSSASSDVLLGLRARARRSCAGARAAAASRSSVEGRDAELLVDLARRLGAQARDVA